MCRDELLQNSRTPPPKKKHTHSLSCTCSKVDNSGVMGIMLLCGDGTIDPSTPKSITQSGGENMNEEWWTSVNQRYYYYAALSNVTTLSQQQQPLNKFVKCHWWFSEGFGISAGAQMTLIRCDYIY